LITVILYITVVVHCVYLAASLRSAITNYGLEARYSDVVNEAINCLASR